MQLLVHITCTCSCACKRTCLEDECTVLKKLKVLGHALRMHSKYITSCIRPPVWWHLRVNRSSERGLCLLIA